MHNNIVIYLAVALVCNQALFGVLSMLYFSGVNTDYLSNFYEPEHEQLGASQNRRFSSRSGFALSNPTAINGNSFLELDQIKVIIIIWLNSSEL